MTEEIVRFSSISVIDGGGTQHIRRGLTARGHNKLGQILLRTLILTIKVH